MTKNRSRVQAGPTRPGTHNYATAGEPQNEGVPENEGVPTPESGASETEIATDKPASQQAKENPDPSEAENSADTEKTRISEEETAGGSAASESDASTSDQAKENIADSGAVNTDEQENQNSKGEVENSAANDGTSENGHRSEKKDETSATTVSDETEGDFPVKNARVICIETSLSTLHEDCPERKSRHQYMKESLMAAIPQIVGNVELYAFNSEVGRPLTNPSSSDIDVLFSVNAPSSSADLGKALASAFDDNYFDALDEDGVNIVCLIDGPPDDVQATLDILASTSEEASLFKITLIQVGQDKAAREFLRKAQQHCQAHNVSIITKTMDDIDERDLAQVIEDAFTGIDSSAAV